MIFMDSFGHYTDVEIGLKWDEVGVPPGTGLTTAIIDHPKSGGRGLLFTGDGVAIKKELGSVYSQLFVGFRCTTTIKFSLIFGYGEGVLSKFIIDLGGSYTRLQDVDGVGKNTLFNTVEESAYYEVRFIGGLSGSMTFWKDGVLQDTYTGNFFNISNGVEWITFHGEDLNGAYLSDVWIDTVQNGVLAIKSFFPLEDVITEWWGTDPDHYSIMTPSPIDTDRYILSSYGLLEVLRYRIGIELISSITAFALTPALRKSFGAVESGLGVRGVERKRGDNYGFGKVYPNNLVRYHQMVSKILPSTGGSPNPSDITVIDLGLVVER